MSVQPPNPYAASQLPAEAYQYTSTPVPAWAPPPPAAPVGHAAPKPPRSRRLLLALAVVAVLAVGGIAYALTSGGSSGVKVHGSLLLTGTIGDDIEAGAGTQCQGGSGYSDLAEGVQVIITDDKGKTLTVVPLGDGVLAAGSCTFSFDASVPSGRSSYGVTISHRGTVVYTPSQIVAPVLTIGQ